MLLARKLPKEDIDRHQKLIRKYSRDSLGTDNIEIEFLANGVQKGVYKVTLGNQSLVACAAAIDIERELIEEYSILHQLFKTSPKYFPRPIAHYSSGQEGLGELITMELLPHRDLNKLRNPGNPNFYRNLAESIGEAIADVNIESGRYSSEPSDGNILGREYGDNVEIKFCDAIQFKQGNIEDAAHSILLYPNVRPECFRFIGRFRDGMAKALVNHKGAENFEDAKKQLEFLRSYNSII